MTSRTTRSIVRFTSPFLLPGMDVPQPAGEYRVDRDEESIGGISRLAWRCVGTFIHLPAVAERSATRQMVSMGAGVLEAALTRDRTR